MLYFIVGYLSGIATVIVLAALTVGKDDDDE